MTDGHTKRRSNSCCFCALIGSNILMRISTDPRFKDFQTFAIFDVHVASCGEQFSWFKRLTRRILCSLLASCGFNAGMFCFVWGVKLLFLQKLVSWCELEKIGHDHCIEVATVLNAKTILIFTMPRPSTTSSSIPKQCGIKHKHPVGRKM